MLRSFGGQRLGRHQVEGPGTAAGCALKAPIPSPIGNILSRKFEYEADEYAVIETKNPSAFKNTLEKLTDQNLGDKEPHPFIEWFFYSHPSIKNRTRAIDKFAKVNNIFSAQMPEIKLETAE